MIRRFALGLFCLFCLGLIWPVTPASAQDGNGVLLSGNGIVAGRVEIQGVASHPSFRKWQLDLLIDGNAADATFIAWGEDPLTAAGRIATLNSADYPDGDHLLRLRVVHSNLNYEEYFTPITFANGSASSPTIAQPAQAVETAPTQPALILAGDEDDPNGLQLAGESLQGVVSLRGVATHASFRKWQIDLLLNRDPAQAHFVALGESSMPSPGTFAELDTRQFPDGEHLLRLRVVHSNLNYEEYYTPVTLRNGNARLATTPAETAPTETALAEAAPVLRTKLDSSAAPADGLRRIEVDLSDQTLTAYQGDVVVMHTIVSTGRPATPTVLGRYNIRTKIPAQRMRGPGYDLPNVPSVMYFFAGYAIHGAYWHDNFGQTMSHGCVNMRLDEAAALYEWASVGTEVYVQE
jgi:lipoprotein-anchoring transpeptidase ErfK/SrfK